MGSTDRTNVVLIGMPGVGKSTVGVLLAKRAGLQFIDTDLLIQAAEGRTLQQIVDQSGKDCLLAAEEQAVLSVTATRAVISTGGSVVYSARAMSHLQQAGRVVLLDAQLATLRTRVGDHTMRGLARDPGQSLEDLFAERQDLYERYAELRIRTDSLTHTQVVEELTAQLGG